jgi:DNA-3-methyladenine glycosylase I
VNHKPILSKFRYPRQVPVKTPKAEVISKDLVRRGFRGVGPTVIYSFMQVVGLTKGRRRIPSRMRMLNQMHVIV